MNRSSVNMTEGGILKNLIFFAIPVLIGNVFQQLYNVADTAIIGHTLGNRALAAVGASSPFYGLLISLAYGFTNGFSVVIARYFGANDEKMLKNTVSMTYIISACMAAVLTIGGTASIHTLMTALGTPDEIIADTESYLRIIITFSAVTIAYNMFAGMLRAIGNSIVPLLFLIVSTVLNIGLDFLFILGFGMGVAGAAYATVISQAFSVVLCIIYLSSRCRILFFDRSECRMNSSLFGDLLATGFSMGLMLAIVSVGSLILQSAVNSFGTGTITAHTAARKMDEIFMMPLATISMSSSTFASQNFGAHKLDRVKKGIKTSIIIAEVWSLFAFTMGMLFRVPIIHAITGTSDLFVLSTATKYIAINFSFFFVLSVLLVLRSSLQGVGRKLIPVSGSIVELILKFATTLFFAPVLGYFGVCISEPVIWTICAIIVFVDYLVFVKKTENTENEPGPLISLDK